MSQPHNTWRVAVIWPRSRAGRWRSGGASAPDQSDALLYLEEHGFRVHIEDSTPFPLNPFGRMHEFWSGLDPARAARLWWRSGRYDLVIGVGDAVAYYPLIAQRWLGWKTPLVLIDPALSHEYPRRQQLQDVVLPRADKVVVFGRAQLDYLSDRYGDGVDAELLLHRADTSFYCPSSGCDDSSSDYFVSVGGDKSRDYETLAAAVDIARRSMPAMRGIVKTHLDIPRRTPGLEADRSHLGWFQLRDLYRRARFVVLPLHDSLHAGGINTLVEAMSIAKGVIVSDSRGIRDYVRSGCTALTVPAEDPQALAQALLDFWQQPAKARMLGSHARQFAIRHLDNRVYAERLAGILRQVLQRKGYLLPPGDCNSENSDPKVAVAIGTDHSW